MPHRRRAWEIVKSGGEKWGMGRVGVVAGRVQKVEMRKTGGGGGGGVWREREVGPWGVGEEDGTPLIAVSIRQQEGWPVSKRRVGERERGGVRQTGHCKKKG